MTRFHVAFVSRFREMITAGVSVVSALGLYV